MRPDDAAPAPDGSTVSARINADQQTVFRLVAEVELWPALFPNVRFARVVGNDGHRRLIELRSGWLGAARRLRAVQTLDEAAGTVRFQVGGKHGGGSVVWQITPIQDAAESACAVTVTCSEGSGPRTVFGAAMLERVREIAEGASLAGRA